jgi:hypothetical protein
VERDALFEFIERARGLQARAELDEAAGAVLDALEEAGIGALLLKGPALARLLYRPDEHRGYSDVDLLVDPDRRAPARDVLIGLGYTDASARAVHGVVDVADIQHAEIWTRRVGGRAGPVLVDLHWRLPGWEAPAQAAWDALLSRPAWIDLEGRRTAVPDRSALALHLATHAAQHGPQDAKALGDLTRGIERWEREVWSAAAELASEVGATAAMAAGLRLVDEGVAVARELDLPAADAVTWAIANRADRPRGTFHVRAFAEARGARERATVLRHSLLPTRLWITRRYPWALRNRALVLAAYAAHLASAPAWAVRAWRFSRRPRRRADG